MCTLKLLVLEFSSVEVAVWCVLILCVSLTNSLRGIVCFQVLDLDVWVGDMSGIS